MSLRIHRSAILHFLSNPTKSDTVASTYQYIEDGGLVVEDGYVVGCLPFTKAQHTYPQAEILQHSNALLMPGFVDTHIHYPQTEMIAAYGEQLLEWLNTYTFPTEQRFADPEHAQRIAKIFLDELLRAGTTSALVFGTVHPTSVDALFTEAAERNLRLIAGKVMMDRHCPDALQDTAQQSYEESKALIARWHNHGRLQYAVTPRFAPTSTRAQLDKAGQLLQENPSVYLHTHLSENKAEVAWVQSLFPESTGYLDVYDQSNLLGRRSIFAHAIHLEDSEWTLLAETQSGIAFCPTSNLFLGSGLFDLQRANQEDVRVGLGTDIGAGTSFSILETINEAYKVQQLRGDSLSPFHSLYLATLGGAETLDLSEKIGNFETGKEADFIILDRAATPLLDFRLQQCTSLFEELFVFSMLGDDRCIRETWVMGERAHQR